MLTFLTSLALVIPIDWDNVIEQMTDFMSSDVVSNALALMIGISAAGWVLVWLRKVLT